MSITPFQTTYNLLIITLIVYFSFIVTFGKSNLNFGCNLSKYVCKSLKKSVFLFSDNLAYGNFSLFLI
ncbi:hypothetical protein HMPREF2753_10470 [Neisseria sp. HMSC071C03]|jgi:hypothetical protein|uniref:Uncharacterized protein n=1 Tax=Morococcus cerebrosus TaxID=1056807 RepID=A0A0C1EFK4_9NEIS|nr:hypothetical protein MCC93_13570 [Morococcus cerebrosus]KJJ22998.1 hypothetical protein HMPREF3156_00112 [Neisseria sp. HMSC06F02]OFJ61616.1 hypothetical protein HMPREF2858_05275 [Neisseria sp. HMSC073B07]OFS03906.1 hypothetical protein HMPREF2954_02595 [Neisseria sp. HMSC067H09]OHR44570.1 hypothetical protein HMPREF3054_10895 [Neisseria sp. HMSC071B12]OHR50123.1 hypothetical protein HMPREF2753_10470 [Neisseria sp. HMSC071C03]